MLKSWDRFSAHKDRVGHGYSDPEILNWVDEKFLLTNSLDIQLLTDQGEFSIARHRENRDDRGDEDSLSRRQATVEEIGIRQELRSPPWLAQHPTLGVDNRFESLHWGTLFEATRRAWLKDVKKENAAVQTSIKTPVKSAKLYRRDLPRDADRFLVGYGNRLNEEATATTILQVWRSTTVVEPAWARHRQQKQWTAASLGQQVLNEKKHEFACVMYPGRWPTYTSYERSNTFFKTASGVMIGDADGKSVFDDLHAKFKSSVAASQMSGANFDIVLKVTYDACRVLKDEHPEAISDVALLSMPKTATLVAFARSCQVV